MSGIANEVDRWSQAQRRHKRSALLGAGVFAALLAVAAQVSEFRIEALVSGLPESLRYFASLGPDLGTNGIAGGLKDWAWGWKRWLAGLLDTLIIAFLATLLASLAAAPLSFVAAENLGAPSAFRVAARALLQFARTVPDLVLALIFVIALGLGPMAGVLALGVHSMGSLGKLFAGVNENIDTGPIYSLHAAGGNWLQTMRFAVLPQTLPGFVSYALLRLEINVRSAAVVGFVGVGGIGHELYTAVRQFVYPDVGAILLLIIATVVIIDRAGDWLREQIRAREEAHVRVS